MKKSSLFILTITVFSVNIVFAHGGLELSSKEEIIKTQKMLVKEGLLKAETGFVYGKVDIYTDEAYDKYIVQKRIKEFQEDKAKRASSTPVVEEKVEVKTFWQTLLSYFKFW